MAEGSYIVHLLASEDSHPFKHFIARNDAIAFARARVEAGEADRADIYVVEDATNPSAALAAVKMGAAELAQCVTPHASEAEIEATNQRAWDEAGKQGGHAMLKFLGLIQ